MQIGRRPIYLVIIQVRITPRAASVEQNSPARSEEILEPGGFNSASHQSPVAGLRKCYFTKAEDFVLIAEQARIDIRKKYIFKNLTTKLCRSEITCKASYFQSICGCVSVL